MRILIVSDAWTPQVNGVVRTLQATQRELEAMGHIVKVIGPDRFRTIPCPGYAEIRLAIAPRMRLARLIEKFAPDAIHIATEGTLGLAARNWCMSRGFPFTTAYHTQFPDYLAARSLIPADWVWRYIRWFHGPAAAVLVSTNSIAETLLRHGIGQLRRWGRGVDSAIFRPEARAAGRFQELGRPVQLFVGRLAVEKNIEAFLGSGVPGTKVVVGDGPARAELEARFPESRFVGPLFGEALAEAYADADVFVFPSRTDTFGLVMIEALACGTPVAAFPVPGPIDVVDPVAGALDDDLEGAIRAALTRDRNACATHGARFTWRESALQFLDALARRDAELRAA